nr:Uncharacterised protein [Salmonella sp. NCTC 7297]
MPTTSSEWTRPERCLQKKWPGTRGVSVDAVMETEAAVYDGAGHYHYRTGQMEW